MAAKTRVGTVYICSFSNCSKTYKKQSRLQEHFRIHTGERPFVCTEPGCTKSYARAAHLRRHIHVSHPRTDDVKTPQKFNCTYEGCGQVFTLAHNLKKHLKQVHTKKSYKCSFEGCMKTFHKHHQLKTHQFEHTNVKPYVCPVDDCGKSFLLPSKLKQHQKTHNGFTCDVDGCTFKVAKWSLLWKHKSVEHSTIHSCSQCDKTFKRKLMLKRHMAVHQELRQAFQCPRDGCARAYFEEKNLLAHIRSYHDGRRFPCLVEGCGRTLCSKSKLLQHAKLHDPNRPPPKKRKKKSIAAVLSGFIKKRAAKDVLVLDSDEEKISVQDIKRREITPTANEVTVHNSENVTPCLEVDRKANNDIANDENVHKTDLFCGHVQNGCMLDTDSSFVNVTNETAVEKGTDNNDVMDGENTVKDILLKEENCAMDTIDVINNTLVKRRTKNNDLANGGNTVKDVLLKEHDCVIETLGESTYLLKCVRETSSNLEQGEYSVTKECSLTSLPVGQILENSSLVNAT